MKHKTIAQIKQLAKGFADKKGKWHFHLLTPECQLNEVDEYPLILEDSSQNEVYIHIASAKPMGTGKELLQLLHGKAILQQKKTQVTAPSAQMQMILARAKDLNAKGYFWHHHVLFPDCIYNKHKGKWTLLLEDQRNGEILESVTDSEPRSDISAIETLFYQQKK